MKKLYTNDTDTVIAEQKYKKGDKFFDDDGRKTFKIYDTITYYKCTDDYLRTEECLDKHKTWLNPVVRNCPLCGSKCFLGAGVLQEVICRNHKCGYRAPSLDIHNAIWKAQS